jgi:hypothetical protein
MMMIGGVALAGCLFPGVHQVTPKLMKDTASPGLWHTFGGTNCYFARLSDFSGKDAGNIGSFNSPGGPRYVEIKETDAGFNTQGCLPWAEADGPLDKHIGAVNGQFTQGDYRVGTDVDAGDYTASVTNGCVWQRLSGFGSENSDIIASDTDNPAVTIDASDVGFRTWGCGVWTKTP